MNVDNKSNAMKYASMVLLILSTSVMMLAVYLFSTFFYSDYHIDNNNDNLYRVETTFNLPNGEKVRSAKSPLPLIEEIQKDSQVKKIDYFFKINMTLEKDEKRIPKVPIIAVSSDFLHTLSPFNKEGVFLKENEIFITKKFNDQYLHLQKPKGKSIILNNQTYIIKDLLEKRNNNSLDINAIILFNPNLMQNYNIEKFNWYDTHAYLFIKLTNKIQKENQDNFLNNIIATKATNLPGAPFTATDFIHLTLKKMKDIHYQDGLPDEISAGLSKEVIYSSYAALAFILFAAITNYYSLISSYSSEKRDIYQLKKALGASTLNIIYDTFPKILIKSICSIIIFLFLSICIIHYSAYIRNVLNILDTHQLIFLTIFSIFLSFIITSLINLSFLLRFYFYQRNRKMDMRYESIFFSWFKKTSLAIQLFVAGISIYLVTGLVSQYIQLMELHIPYDNTNTLSIDINNDNNKKLTINKLGDELIKNKIISSSTFSSWRPFDMSRENITIYHSGQKISNKYIYSNVITADENFTNVWKIRAIAGENNNIYQSNDENTVNAIVTKEFLTQNGITKFDDIFNNYYWYMQGNNKIQIRFIQVIENFNLAAIDEPFRPIVIFIKKGDNKYISFNVNNIKNTPVIFDNLLKHGFSKNDIDLTSQLFDAYYNNHWKLIKLTSTTAIFSIVLLMLSCFTTSMTDFNGMKKEFSIMESIGGSIYTNLIHFLSKSILPIIASIFIAYLSGKPLLDYLLKEYNISYANTFVYSTLALSATMIFTIIILIAVYLINYKKLSSAKFL
ncbi:darobactin export ABC transporter permease subunit [Xenorhabdus griffiniae]|uniref:darobactin export ABC transporter permease subunit n=1 Tax=Xenorhabdus griffiniae TaxID=351672 RepID=UPI0030D3E513